MSASPPKADIASLPRYVRLVPFPKIGRLAQDEGEAGSLCFVRRNQSAQGHCHMTNGCLLGDHLVLAVALQRLCVARHHLRHDRFTSRRPLDPEDVTWKIERFLNRPDPLVFMPGQDLGWSPTAIQPSGTVAPSGSAVRRCTMPLMRTSARRPIRAPLKMVAPVAMKTSASIEQPV